MKVHNYTFFLLTLASLFISNIQAQVVKPRITAVQSIPNSPYGEEDSDVGYWNNPDTWDLARIPTHGDTIVIPDGITVKIVLNNPNPGMSNNRLSNAVIIVQNGGGLSWHPFIPGPAGQGEKLFLECNSVMHVEQQGWLWGDQVGDKISYCNKYVWSGDGNQNFGPYTWGEWLPVELMFFRAEVNNNNIILKWSTLSETNNDFFVLEKGSSAHDFSIIATIPGSGNSNVPQYYSHEDQTEPNTLVYYRLSQYDYDGTQEVIGVITAASGIIHKQELLMFKNPVTADEQIQLTLLKEIQGVIKIMTPEGKLVYSNEITPHSGNIQVGNLKPGMYVIILETEYLRASYKLIVI